MSDRKYFSPRIGGMSIPSRVTVRHLALLAVGFLLTGCLSSAQTASESYCQEHYTPPVETNENIKLLSLNIAHGRRDAFNQMFVDQQTREANLEAIAAQISDSAADIVALQEADAPSRWSGKFNHVAFLRQNAGYQCSLQGHHADTWLFTYGTALLTRSHSYNQSSVRFNATPPTTTKGFVKAVFDWNFDGNRVPVTAVSVHLDFASNSARNDQVRKLAEEFADIDTPLIVMGDLNSHWHQKKSHVKLLADRLNLQVYKAEKQNLGTFGSSTPRRLDWILISEHLRFVDYRVLPDLVSDHRAVFAEIAYKDSTVRAQYKANPTLQVANSGKILLE